MGFVGELLPYQPEAVDRMCERGSMLVSYDLGLGKTVLTIAAIERLMDEHKIVEPGLVVCLSSLKYQWANQITKFTGGTSKPLVIDGSKTQRESQYRQARNWQESGVDYIIMNYEQVVNDWELVRKLPRGFVVLDEATAIKSFRSKRSKYTKKLTTAPYKFALTGTPIENGKPEELFSIMQFVDPSVLGRFDIFDQTFIVRNDWGGVDRYRNLPMLHERMKLASVRKSQKDEDVAPFLPDSIHEDPVFVTLDRKTAKLYQRVTDDILIDLENAQELFGDGFNLMAHYGYEQQWGQADALRGQIMSKVGALKMLCSSPELLKASAVKFKAGNGDGSAYAAELDDAHLLDNLPETKLKEFTAYAKDFLEQNEQNKLVVFCTHVAMVRKIADALGQDITRMYTGSLDSKTREKHKKDFNDDPTVRVLVSSDAGGYGVDLPAANMLINYDLPWSAGLAIQRNGRIQRASSEWPTIVIQDFLISGSIEVRQHDALKQKSSVAAAVIDGKGIDNDGGLDLTLGSLRSFLLETSV